MDSINSGNPRAGEYLSYIDQDVKALVASGMLSATTDFESIKHNPIHFLAVPTEKDDEPYMNIVRGVMNSLITTIPRDGIIVVESTLVPGTIDSLKLSESQKNMFHIAVCPRLDWFGDKAKNISNLPRIIGGVTLKATEVVAELLAPICKDIRKFSYRVAEMAKASQNSFYHAQVDAAYQTAYDYQSFVDMNEVLDAVGCHWRLNKFYLGAGISGRCVPMGSKYLIQGARDINGYSNLSIPKAALRFDDQWREILGDFITKRFDFAQSQTVKIMIMGIAYNANFSDFGNSAPLDIAEYLYDALWDVSINDPIILKSTLEKATKVPFDILGPDFDAVMLATGHDTYKYLPEHITWRKGQFIVDCPGLWEGYRSYFENRGVDYVRIGEKGWLDK